MRRFGLLCFIAGCSAWAVPKSTPQPVSAWSVPDTAIDVPTSERPEDETDSEYHVGDYCLYDYFRSSPPCSPCIRWSANEKHLVDCKVKQWDTSTRSLGWVDSVPTFRLLWCNTESKKWDDVKLWTGYISAKAINTAIQTHKDKQAQTQSQPVVCGQQLTVRRSESDLRSWISEHYSQNSRLNRATVSPRSFVWEHLRNDHGFTGEQVNGLPQWMALALHDAVHPESSPLITPWTESISVTATPVSPRTASVRIHSRSPDGNGDAGSGTVISSNVGTSYVLTCAHILTGRESLTVRDMATKQEYPATIVIKRMPPADIAILRVQADLPAVKVARTTPEVGTNLVSYGCDHAGPLSRADCVLLTVDRFSGPSNLVCSGHQCQGRSGGGLFDLSGRLVGVCSGMFSPDRGIFTGGRDVRSLISEVQP